MPSIIPHLLYFLSTFTQTGLSSPRPNPKQPLATVKNGTLGGSYLPTFDQDAFYGIPFAAPPVGPLRFRHPEIYDEAWTEVKDATARSLSCAGFGPFSEGLDMGEDCLTLDIVRPSRSSVGVDNEDLPVLVWIYGGGLLPIM